MTEPLELYAPLEWSHQELEGLRGRVRALMAAGHPRSVASVAAFHELTALRALERAKAETSFPIGNDVSRAKAETSVRIRSDVADQREVGEASRTIVRDGLGEPEPAA